jgi:hypothetical protein
MRVNGNEPLSRAPDEPAPPAGGFGATPASSTIAHLAAPRPRSSNASQHVFVIAFAILVAAGLGLMTWGMRKRQRDIRAAEAKNTLGSIGKDLAIAYLRDRAPCPDGSPIPRDVERIRGQRYESRVEEWRGDPGWKCIEFEMREPQHYQYRFETSGDLITVSAIGDYDGNCVSSSYVLTGHIDREGKMLRLDPVIRETHPGE